MIEQFIKDVKGNAVSITTAEVEAGAGDALHAMELAHVGNAGRGKYR